MPISVYGMRTSRGPNRALLPILYVYPGASVPGTMNTLYALGRAGAATAERERPPLTAARFADESAKRGGEGGAPGARGAHPFVFMGHRDLRPVMTESFGVPTKVAPRQRSPPQYGANLWASCRERLS